MPMTPDYWGALDWVRESTWRMWETVLVDEVPKPRYTRDDLQREVNQTQQIWPNSCTLACAFWCVADNLGHAFFDQDMKRLYSIAVDQWLDPSVWRYLYKAVDLVRDYLEERYDIESSTLTVRVWSDHYYRLLDMWYSIATWFQGNSSYNQDKNEDGILTHGWVHRKSTYWHAIRHKDKLIVVDNYKGVTHNLYDNQALDLMINKKRQFNRGFIFFDKHTMPDNNLPSHNPWETIEEKEIVKARELEVQNPYYKVYTDDNYLTRMLIDLYDARKQARSQD